MAQKTIVVVGSLNFDLVFKVPRLPHKGETLTAESLALCGGGKGANQAVQCAKLGVKTYMAGKVGADSFGDTLLAGLAGYGVDVRHVGKSHTHGTGVGAVNALPDGGVHATISTGANFDMDETFVDAIDPLLQQCSAVVLQMEIPIPVVEEVLRRAKGYGACTILNAAPAKPIAAAALRLVDCFVVNESEASFYVGEAVKDLASARRCAPALLAMTGGTVVVTLGKNGSLLCGAGGLVHIAANAAVKAVETTGAGDSYIGALAVQKVQGATEEEACRFASRVADVTVTRVGAQGSMPTLADL